MRSYKEALEYSRHHPSELVKFKTVYRNRQANQTGFFLNGEREGVFNYYSNDNIVAQKDTYNSKTSHSEHICFWGDGSARWHYFSRKDIMHGECIYFNEGGAISDNYFNINSGRVSELDYLINEPRDDAFYFTLSLYGIDKEYTIGAV